MKTLLTAAIITMLSFGSAMADQFQDYGRYNAADWTNTQSDQMAASNLEQMAPTAAGRSDHDNMGDSNLNGPFDMQD